MRDPIEAMDLRDDESPETIAWQERANVAAAEYLSTLHGRDDMQRRIAALLTDTRQAPVVGRGGRWFQQVVLNTADQEPVVAVRDRPSGEPRVLVDPNALSVERGKSVTVLAVVPSPDGSTLACTIMEAGAEVFELLLIDVETGESLPDRIPWNVANLTWLPDSSGFWCTTRAVIEGEYRVPLYRHLLGTELTAPILTPPDTVDATVVVSAHGEHVALRTGNAEQRMDWIIRDGVLEPLLLGLPGSFAGAFDVDDLIAITDHEAPRGRLVRIPVATAGDTSTWTELLAESDHVLRQVAVVGATIVLGSLREASCEIRLLDGSGTVVEEVDLGAPGAVGSVAFGASHPSLPMFIVGDDEISFVRSTFDSSWSVYRYAVTERRLEVLTAPTIEVDGFVVSTRSAVSSDGAIVPAHVVHRADLDISVPQPTLIYGYGGFNISNLPSFTSSWTAWVEAGGVFVLAHLRGNSEYGSDWWRQGRREVKQQTFDDLYAVAEELIAAGVTTSGQLAVRGESNGGLLTGAAIVQRPDLWAGVSSDVPILDLLGYEHDPLTYAIGKEEYGDPRVAAEAEWLRRISPVHNVEAASYPAVLVTAGANDPRCPTWHSRVFVDLLQQAQSGEAPILLRVYEDQGHGAAGVSDRSAKEADWLTFLATATGLDVRSES